LATSGWVVRDVLSWSLVMHHALTFAFALSLTACAVGDLDLDDESLDVTEQEVLSGWTPFTSEEFPPITCDGQSLPAEIEVTGPYADNIRMRCVQDSRIIRGDSYWTPWFSEEYASMMSCGPRYWITGLACTGRYCDNLSIQCTKIQYSYPRLASSLFGGPVSEEQRFLDFAGKRPIAAMCLGSYCDQLKFVTAYLEVETPVYPDRIGP